MKASAGKLPTVTTESRLRRHRLSFRIAAVIALFGARSLVLAAPSQPPAATVLPDQVDLARLVDLCSQRLQINIEYDPAALKGAAATLRLGSPVSDAELWSLTNRLLASHGFTTVRAPTSAPNCTTTPNPGDNHPAPGELATYSVVKSSEAAAAARIEEGPDGSLFAAGFKTVVVRTAHRSAKDLAEALKPFLTKSGAGQVGSASIVEVGSGPATTAPAALHARPTGTHSRPREAARQRSSGRAPADADLRRPQPAGQRDR